jgi:uncharacterized protein YjiS (DUF1127 family)
MMQVLSVRFPHRTAEPQEACRDRRLAMKTISYDPSAGTAPVRPSLASLLLGGMSNAARKLVREMRIRRDRRYLESLSDGMLSDIGISRGHITHALREGRLGSDAAPVVPVRTRTDRDMRDRALRERDRRDDMSNIVRFMRPAAANPSPICAPDNVATSFSSRQ